MSKSTSESSKVSEPSSGAGQGDLWEVFVQLTDGQPHSHAGSVRAHGAELALQNARDVYSRRGNVSSIWIVPSPAIVATSGEDTDAFFEPSNTKAYRHPQFYTVPRGVKNL